MKFKFPKKGETSGYFSPYTSNSQWDISRMCFLWHPSLSLVKIRSDTSRSGKVQCCSPTWPDFLRLPPSIHLSSQAWVPEIAEKSGAGTNFSPIKPMNRGSGVLFPLLSLTCFHWNQWSRSTKELCRSSNLYVHNALWPDCTFGSKWHPLAL